MNTDQIAVVVAVGFQAVLQVVVIILLCRMSRLSKIHHGEPLSDAERERINEVTKLMREELTKR